VLFLEDIVEELIGEVEDASSQAWPAMTYTAAPRTGTLTA